jgi:hypothetical protein
MAEKLGSISRQIHWPLLVRAVIFALAWWYLPAWLFCIAAAGIYFWPILGSLNNMPAFVVLAGVSLATAPSALMALMYGVLCYYLLLIKDYLVVDRKSARTMLAMALSFFLFSEFFSAWHAGFSSAGILWAWILAIAFGALLNGVIAPRRGKEVDDEDPSARHLRHAAVGISAFILFEALAVSLFLPVDFMCQTIIAFLVAALLLDLVPAYFFRELDPRRIRVTAIAVFVLFVVTLAAATWRI